MVKKMQSEFIGIIKYPIVVLETFGIQKDPNPSVIITITCACNAIYCHRSFIEHLSLSLFVYQAFAVVLALLPLAARSQNYYYKPYPDPQARIARSDPPAPPAYAPAAPAYAPGPYLPPVYDFAWDVLDTYSGNDFGHKESRNDKLTTGSYHVALPDGRVQTVTYTVDGYGGYAAEVTYAGEAAYPETPAYHPAPAPYKPAPAPYVPAESKVAPAPVVKPAPVAPAAPAYAPAPAPVVYKPAPAYKPKPAPAYPSARK